MNVLNVAKIDDEDLGVSVAQWRVLGFAQEARVQLFGMALFVRDDSLKKDCIPAYTHSWDLGPLQGCTNR